MALMGKYIYCFIKEKEKLSFGSSTLGNLNAPVYTVPYKEVSAVISDAPIIEYDPTRKNILAHQSVLKKVMERYTIIPVAFGTVASNKKDIELIISSNYDKFIDNAEYLKDKIELGLRVTWDKDYFNKDIEDEKITQLKNRVAGKEEEEVLSDKVELGKLVETAILSKRKEYTNKIYKRLEEIAVESKVKDTVPIKTVLNSYFLVEKYKEEEFDREVAKLMAEYQNKLILNYTGPWPPYNFVNMNINLSDIKK